MANSPNNIFICGRGEVGVYISRENDFCLPYGFACQAARGMVLFPAHFPQWPPSLFMNTVETDTASKYLTHLLLVDWHFVICNIFLIFPRARVPSKRSIT